VLARAAAEVHTFLNVSEATTRASGECATAVIDFKRGQKKSKRTKEEDDSHRGRHQQSLFVCAVVGARQGQDADTQGLTRRALKTSRDVFKGHRVLARAAAEVHVLICEFVYVLICFMI